MPSVSVLCFGASYAVSLVLEIVGLKVRFGWHRVAMLLFAMAGLVAHVWYLGQRAAALPQAPLATESDWCLLAALVLAVVYVSASLYWPRSSVGLFVLPVVLLLVGASLLAGREPLNIAQTSRFWGLIHGAALLAGTVTVSVGFLAGLMYLIQSYRLKHKLPPTSRFRLPSLELLERANSQSLAVSTLFMAAGFFTGVLLGWMKHRDEPSYLPWTDPVVLSLAAMLGWLVMAEVFRLVYPSARQGRKVAYLTLAAFVFLVFTLAAITLQGSMHGSSSEDALRVVDDMQPQPEPNSRPSAGEGSP